MRTSVACLDFQGKSNSNSAATTSTRSPTRNEEQTELERSMIQDPSEGLTILTRRGKTDYPDSPEKAKIETFANKYPTRDYVVEFDCPEFTSMCPITGQPDFARIHITYVPDLTCIESKSLKLYLFSFRNMGMFHEEITNRILDDLVAACQPRWAQVSGIMNPRGGISIDVTAQYRNPDFNGPVPK
jgi:7-cyano-7-deazaguanine reductase